MISIAEAARRRHTVKAYEPGARLTDEQVEQLISTLHYAPSSVNSQPWHFVVAGSSEARARLAKAADGMYAYNAPKIINASHVIAFCIRVDMTNEHLRAVLQQEQSDGRFKREGAMEQQDAARRGYVDLHRFSARDIPNWAERQAYLALGTLLLGSAVLGIDSTPMEGFDTAILDKELGLRERGLTSVVLCALGKRSAEDFNAVLPKSRLPREEVFTIL